MSASAMETFVRKLFAEVKDLSLLTQRIVREKYLEHLGATEISLENKHLLKQIVKLFLENMSNNEAKDEQLARQSPRRSPRKSFKKDSPEKSEPANLGEPGSATSSVSTVSSWARTPPKTNKASRNWVSADQARRAVLESSPEKSPKKKALKDVSPRKKSRKEVEREPGSPSQSLRRSPRKGAVKARARLSAEQARSQILDSEFTAEGDVDLDSGEEDDEDSEDEITQTSGTKKAKWKSKRIERDEGSGSDTTEEPEVLAEPFKDEAPLGTYNSSDSDSSEDSDFVVDAFRKKKATSTARRRKTSWDSDSVSESEDNASDDKFVKLKKVRAAAYKANGRQTSDEKSEGVTAQSELQSRAVNDPDSESNQTPIKIKRRRPARSRVLSDVESDHSTPVKPDVARSQENIKTILDVVEMDDVVSDRAVCPAHKSDSSSTDGECSSTFLKRQRKKGYLERKTAEQVSNKGTSRSTANRSDDSSSDFEVPMKFKSKKTACVQAASTQSEDTSESSPERKVHKGHSEKRKKTMEKGKEAKKRKRSSVTSSDSESETKSSRKGAKKRKTAGSKVDSTDPTKNRNVRHLEKIARAVGGIIPVGRNYKEMFSHCKTASARVKLLKQKLREAGMEGQPSMKGVAAVKLKKEARELDLGNVIHTSGRSSRTQLSRDEPQRVKPLQTKPCRVRITPLKTRLAGIIDSEESDSD